MNAMAVVATTRHVCFRTLLVSIVVALIVVVTVVLVLRRLVFRLAPRLRYPIVALRPRDHATTFIDSARIIHDLAVRIYAPRIVNDLAVRVDPSRIIHATTLRIIHATILIVYVSPRIARVYGALVAIDDSGVGWNACRGRCAVRWSGLVTGRNAVDPNPAHPGGGTLTRWYSLIAAPTTLRHRRR